MADDRPGFWSTLPGILTGLAAVITSLSGVYFGYLKPREAAVATAAPAQPPRNEATPTAAPSAAPANGAEVRATVIDPDGWTNLRTGPSTGAAVVVRVREGEVFWTRPSDGQWWPARTAAGAEGYVHRSRVRLNP